jgi:hypothetical protein
LQPPPLAAPPLTPPRAPPWDRNPQNQNPDKLAVPSIRNDAAFLASSVLFFSVLAVLLGQLPGDWGFFTSYLAGSMILVIMGIGSTAPGLLQGIIDQ